jgi:hypothetical protein
MDYSFYRTNHASVPLQPSHPMQFGSALQRVLQHILYCNPTYGPPLLAKLDLANGFYHIPITPTAAQQLAVIIPNDAPYPQFLVTFPLILLWGAHTAPPILLCLHGNHH